MKRRIERIKKLLRKLVEKLDNEESRKNIKNIIIEVWEELDYLEYEYIRLSTQEKTK